MTDADISLQQETDMVIGIQGVVQDLAAGEGIQLKRKTVIRKAGGKTAVFQICHDAFCVMYSFHVLIMTYVTFTGKHRM